MVGSANRVVFEFLGGPRDGERLCGCLASGSYSEAEALFRQTNQAEIGKNFWCPCEYSLNALRTTPLECLEYLEASGHHFQGHIYEIILRWAKRDELLIRARHIGPAE